MGYRSEREVGVVIKGHYEGILVMQLFSILSGVIDMQIYTCD